MMIKRIQKRTADPRRVKWTFRRLLGAPRRLVRRRGFGVHSPFAFDFIRRVISQPCDYYCYPQLAVLAHDAGISAKSLKLVFRVALFFRPATVAVPAGKSSESFLAALLAASPRCRMSEEPEMAVVTSDRDVGIALRCAAAGGVVVFIGNIGRMQAAHRLWAEARCGMMFRGSRMAVYVGWCHLPRQLFNVWF